MDHRRKKNPSRKPASRLFDWRRFDPAMVKSDDLPSLAEELTTYRDRLPELVEHEGEYVIIKGRECEILPDRESALQYALDHYWPEAALVHRIRAKQPYDSVGGAEL